MKSLITQQIFTADYWRQFWHEFLDYLKLINESKLPRLIIILFLICFAGGTAILFVEGEDGGFGNILDSIWWALVTMTTVGYGDKVPLTHEGRLLAAFVMLSGVAVVSLFTATISSVFVAKKLREERGLQKIFYRNHLLILGWNDSAHDLLQTLFDLQSEAKPAKIVLINSLTPEETEEIQQQLKKHEVKFLKGDYTGTAVLSRGKVAEAQTVIILSEQNLPPDAADERTVLAVLAVKSVNSRAKVFVHVRERNSESHLRRAGADRVIVSDKFTGFLLANCAAAPIIPKVVDGLVGRGSNSRIKPYHVPNNYIGRTFAELSDYLKKHNNSLLIGFVAGESILSVDDILSDDISSVDDFIKRKFLEAGRSTDELEMTSININPPLDYKIKEIDLAIVLGGN